MSIRPRTKSNYRKEKDPSRGQNLDYNSWMTDVEKTFFETLIFKYVYFDTMIDVTMKKREQRIGMWYFQYCERRSLQNPKINWKEISRVRIGRIVFTAEASNLQIGRYSRNPKTISGLFNQEWGITQKHPYKNTIHLYCGLCPRSLLYCRSWTGIVREVYTLVQKKETHFLYNEGWTICFDNNASEAEVITDTKKSRKVNHQVHWRPEQNAKDWIYLSATQKRNLADKV